MVPAIDSVLRLLNTLFKQGRFYKPDHPILRARIDEILSALESAWTWTEGRTLSVGALKGKFLVNKEAPGRMTPIVQSLTEMFEDAGLLALEIREGVTAQEIGRLAEAIGLGRQRVRAAGGIAALVPPASVPHIVIRAADWEKLLEAGSVAAGDSTDQRPLEERLLQAIMNGSPLAAGPGPASAAPMALALRGAVARNPRLAQRIAAVGSAIARSGETTQPDAVVDLFERLDRYFQALPAQEREMLLGRIADSIPAPSEPDSGQGAGAPDRVDRLIDEFASIQFLDVMASLVVREGKASERLRSVFSNLAPEEVETQILPRVRAEGERARRGEGKYPSGVWKSVEQLLLRRSESSYMGSTYAQSLDFLAEDLLDVEATPEAAAKARELSPTLADDAIEWNKAVVLLELLSFQSDPEFFRRTVEDLVETAQAYAASAQYDRAHKIVSDLRNVFDLSLSEDPLQGVLAEVISRFRVEDAVATLMDSFEEIPEAQRAAAELLLARFPERSAAVLLPNLFQETRRRVRRYIISVLIALGPPVIPLVMESLDDSRWYVIRNGIHVLGELKAEEAALPISRLARHFHERVRQEAVAALGKIGSRRGLPVLGAIVEKEAWLAAWPGRRDESLRLAAARAIAEIGTRTGRREAADLLRKGAAAKSQELRDLCEGLLARLSPHGHEGLEPAAETSDGREEEPDA
ncbi:MAG: HEAT repeat domain-containing protein [Nitrospirae bacterium]|nr:HEAT repeat domain-containing protein [Nitrospirota bacterium]